MFKTWSFQMQTFSHRIFFIHDRYNSRIVNKILLIPDTILVEPA